MKSKVQTKIVALFVTIGFPFIASQQVFAATADVSSVDSFIKSLIQVLAGLAGLVATGFFVMGGFSYITSYK
jgi:hypothetical protein